jgi:hypothetical protein
MRAPPARGELALCLFSVPWAVVGRRVSACPPRAPTTPPSRARVVPRRPAAAGAVSEPCKTSASARSSAAPAWAGSAMLPAGLQQLWAGPEVAPPRARCALQAEANDCEASQRIGASSRDAAAAPHSKSVLPRPLRTASSLHAAAAVCTHEASRLCFFIHSHVALSTGRSTVLSSSLAESEIYRGRSRRRARCSIQRSSSPAERTLDTLLLHTAGLQAAGAPSLPRTPPPPTAGGGVAGLPGILPSTPAGL